MKKVFGRIISLILYVCMCFSLFGCGGTEEASKKGQSPRPFLTEWTRLAERNKYNSFSF